MEVTCLLLVRCKEIFEGSGILRSDPYGSDDMVYLAHFVRPNASHFAKPKTLYGIAQ